MCAHVLCRLNNLNVYTVSSICSCLCVESRPWGVIRLLSSSSVFVLTEGDREVSGAGCLLFVAASWPVALPCILFSSTRAFLPGFISPWLLFVVIPYQFSPRRLRGRWRCLRLLSAALLCFSCHSTFLKKKKKIFFSLSLSFSLSFFNLVKGFYSQMVHQESWLSMSDFYHS